MIEHETNGKAVQIGVLQEQVKVLQTDMTSLKENHLPHIYTALNSIKVQMAYYAGGIAVAAWIGDGIIRYIFGK